MVLYTWTNISNSNWQFLIPCYDQNSLRFIVKHILFQHIIASWAFHSILGQIWCTLYLSLFGPSNQRFHLQVFRRRNLNRGICHTPFFDLRGHWHVYFDLISLRLFKENSAEKYFKIPHFVFRFGPSSLIFYFIF